MDHHRINHAPSGGGSTSTSTSTTKDTYYISTGVFEAAGASNYSQSAPAQYNPGPSYTLCADGRGGNPTLNRQYGLQWQENTSHEQLPHLSKLAPDLQYGPDLENVTADLTAVNAMHPSDFTSPLHDGPWQPRTILPPVGPDRSRAASDSMLLRQIHQGTFASHGGLELIHPEYDSRQDFALDLEPAYLLPVNCGEEQNIDNVVPSARSMTSTRYRPDRINIRQLPGPASTTRSRRRSSFVSTVCEVPDCDRILRSRSEQT